MCRCVQTFHWYTCNIFQVILNKWLSLLSFEQSCANTTKKTVAAEQLYIFTYADLIFPLIFCLKFKSPQTLKKQTFLIRYYPQIDSVLSHMVVVFSFCLSGIHFVLVVVSPCRVQRIQLTTLLQLALRTSPRYCLALSRSLCSFLSSLFLTFFLLC